MRILIIDDEADQAGIDTADIANDRWTAISNLIGNLFLGKDEKGNDVQQKAKAINYVGYTATPYANILNSGRMKSLYPKDFIYSLSVSKEYFGPQQIFGLKNGAYKGLDIIRKITNSEVSEFKDIHDGSSKNMPKSMENSICWFLCCLAQMRVYQYKKPISMLIHTHQKTDSHARIAKVVENWFKQTPKKDIIKKCEDIWDYESKRFTINDFWTDYPDYANPQIRNYIPFVDIEPIIENILNLNSPLAHIKIDGKGDIKYFEGIHLCIDNSVNNPNRNAQENIRLLYPKEDLGYASAFIVIGGATLSRGLTIEGLVSTYFLRTVKQADTLMQMGRWFGYRRGYEMLPRIWMSDDTRGKFEYLSELDETLRNEIAEMEILGEKPTEYGAKVLLSDNPGKIKISGNKRIQGATDAAMNYMGAYCQTTLFPNDKKLLSDNLDLTKIFIDTLNSPVDNTANPHAAPNYIWRNVSFDKIKTYLKQFHFVSRQKFFGNINSVIDWVGKSTLDAWNVIASNLGNPQNGEINLSVGNIGKVSRTRLANSNSQPSEICIGALRDPKDLMADVDLSVPNQLNQSEIDEIRRGKTKNVKSIRAKLGLDRTPQLIIYFIDKNSQPQPQSTGRLPLDAPEDIVGLCINIPGERTPNSSFTESVSIDLSTIES